MEIYQLKSFLAVAREQNLTKAASLLHLSPSALSSQIKTLEETLGMPLFDRQSRGMFLTHTGEALIPYAEKAIAAIENIKVAARDLGQHLSGHLMVGLNTDPVFLRMTRLESRMADRYAQMTMTFQPSQTLETTAMVRNKAIDAGFRYGMDKDDGVQETWVADTALRVVVPKPLAKMVTRWDWTCIASLPWIWTSRECPFHQLVEARMQACGVRPLVVADAVDEAIVREMVINGKGATVMRKDMAEELAVAGCVDVWDEPLTVPLCIAYNLQRVQDPLIRALLTVVEEIWRE